MKTRFILIETSHAGNVGAAARALATMGFDEMVLVAPRDARVLGRKETIERASGAVEVLRRARVVGSLDEALDGLTHLCATAMIGRDFGPPTLSPRQHFERLAQDLRGGKDGVEGAIEGGPSHFGLGLLFGSERFGMRNAHVWRCHAALRIDSNPAFGSLNLAAAVQLVAHDWRQALGGFGPQRLDQQTPPQQMTPDTHATDAAQAQTSARPAPAHTSPPADMAAVAAALTHWQQALVHTGFLNPAAPKKLLPRLQQLANRAQLRDDEVHILRGAARSVLQCQPPQWGAKDAGAACAAASDVSADLGPKRL